MGEGCRLCCCMSYQTRVIIFAITNVFVTGAHLFLPLVSSAFMIYFQITKQHFEAKFILQEETISIFRRVPTVFLQPRNSSKITGNTIDYSPSPMQSDLHVWTSWLYLKLAIFIYSFILLSGARRKNYNMVLAWFALSVPVAIHSLLILGMDMGLGLMWAKPLRFQIFQGVLAGYQVFGLIFVLFFLRKIHFLRGVRYPEFKRETDVKFRDASNINL